MDRLMRLARIARDYGLDAQIDADNGRVLIGRPWARPETRETGTRWVPIYDVRDLVAFRNGIKA